MRRRFFWFKCVFFHPHAGLGVNTDMIKDSKLVLTAKEVCEVLGISRSSFNKLRKLGVFKPLPYIRRNQKFSFESLLAYISQAPKPQGK
jgi:predicted DNA-binding transcriptional regulator AlpA